MNLIDLTLLAIALGIDCLVVSFSQGLLINEDRKISSLKLATTMGVFQGTMPIIGIIGMKYLYNTLVPYGKYITFSIFLILGLKFLGEASNQKCCENRCLDTKCLIGLGIATSIDALVSGVTLVLTNSKLILACALIGIVSFTMSISGFLIGNKIKNIHPKFLEVLGSIILIILAFRALVI